MKHHTVLSLTAALLLSGTFSQASNVRTDYDHGANFLNHHTYSWGSVKASNPLNEDRVKAAIEKDLQAKGWQLVASGGNATVFATDNVKSEREAETMYDGIGGGWGWGGWGGFGGGFGMGGFGEANTTEENQRVGHLVVDIFDVSSHHLLFRGVADDDLSNKASKNTKNLDKDVNDMFKKFPPKRLLLTLSLCLLLYKVL
jgi:hypothetical protein